MSSPVMDLVPYAKSFLLFLLLPPLPCPARFPAGFMTMQDGGETERDAADGAGPHAEADYNVGRLIA